MQNEVQTPVAVNRTDKLAHRLRLVKDSKESLDIFTFSIEYSLLFQTVQYIKSPDRNLVAISSKTSSHLLSINVPKRDIFHTVNESTIRFLAVMYP